MKLTICGVTGHTTGVERDWCKIVAGNRGLNSVRVSNLKPLRGRGRVNRLAERRTANVVTRIDCEVDTPLWRVADASARPETHV